MFTSEAADTQFLHKKTTTTHPSLFHMSAKFSFQEQKIPLGNQQIAMEATKSVPWKPP
jgi:hypothetical protein